MEEAFARIDQQAKTCNLRAFDQDLALMLENSASQFLSEMKSDDGSPSYSSNTLESIGDQLRLVGSSHPSRPTSQDCSEASRDDGIGQTAFGYVLTRLTEYEVPQESDKLPIDPSRQSLRRSSSTTELSPHSLATSTIAPYSLNLQSLPPVDTYSFLETNFSRRLQRRCLERAYGLFENLHADPQTVYRMFRLAPWIRDKSQMRPAFQQLIKRGTEESLEVDCVPFYGIGGAGTHYPRFDHEGSLVTPSNIRLPKRIIGITRQASSAEHFDEDSYQEHLSRLGYGGTWFDSYEVGCYAQQKGVPLGKGTHETGNFPGVLLPGFSIGSIQSVRTLRSTWSGQRFNVDRFLDCKSCRKFDDADLERADVI
jgi:hypothetical protein